MVDICLLILGALIPVLIGIVLVVIAILAIGFVLIQFAFNHGIEEKI